MNKKPVRNLTFTVVSAPDLPTSEVSPFLSRYKRNKRVVENFDFYVNSVKYGRGDKVLVTAPNIPREEVRALRTHIRRALKDPNYTLVVNYDVSLKVVPSTTRHKAAV